MQKGGAAVFRYVKLGPAKATLPGLQALEDGTWAPGQQGAVDRVARAWTRLWVAPQPEQAELDDLCHSLVHLRSNHTRRKLSGLFSSQGC